MMARHLCTMRQRIAKSGVARVLLDHGADPTIRDNEGMTPLEIGRKCEEFIEELRRRSSKTLD